MRTAKWLMVGVVAGLLLSSAAGGAAAAGTTLTVGAQSLTALSTSVHQVDIYAAAGRSGKHLEQVWVWAGLQESVDSGPVSGLTLTLEELSSGVWLPAGTATTSDDGTARFDLVRGGAGQYRVVFGGGDSLSAVVSPPMDVAASPTTARSRYYLLKHGKGVGEIVRVFADGTATGIALGDMEYSCLVGRLDGGVLTLTTYDFGGGTYRRTATGTWKNLKIKEKGTKRVGAPRRALQGKYKRQFGLCSQVTYAQVATDPTTM